MRVINLTEATRNLSKTFDRVVDGDLTIITRRGDGKGERAVVLLSAANYHAMVARIATGAPHASDATVEQSS